MNRHYHPLAQPGTGARVSPPDASALFRFHLAVLRKAIRDHRLVQVVIPDRPDVSLCVPFDFIPNGPLESDGTFVFYPLTADGRLQERLLVHASRLLRLDWTNRLFDPSQFIGWPTDWRIPRDWPIRRPARRTPNGGSGS